MARYRLRTVSALAAIAGLGLSACGSSTTPEAVGFEECEVYGPAGSVTMTPAKEGTLTVQTNLPSPGWWKGTSPDTIVGGYEYCLAANIAHRAGLKAVTVVNTSFDALVAGQTKDFDVAMAQISVTPEREKVVQFSAPYFDSDVGVLAAKDSNITADNISTKKLGVALGTTSVQFVQDKLKPSTPARVFQDTDTMITAVQAGQIEAAVQDTAIVLGFAKNSDGALNVIGQYKTGEQYAAIYPKGSANAAAIDQAIDAMSADGTLKKLSASWLGPTLGGDPAAVPVFATP